MYSPATKGGGTTTGAVGTGTQNVAQAAPSGAVAPMPTSRAQPGLGGAGSLADLAKLFQSGASMPQPASSWLTAGPITNPVRPTVAMPTATGKSIPTSASAAATPALTDQAVAQMGQALGYYGSPSSYYLNDKGEVMADYGNDRLMGKAGSAWKNLGVPK